MLISELFSVRVRVFRKEERKPLLLRWKVGSGKNVSDIFRGDDIEFVARRSVIIAGLSSTFVECFFSLLWVWTGTADNAWARKVVEAALEGNVHLLRLVSEDPYPVTFG